MEIIFVITVFLQKFSWIPLMVALICGFIGVRKVRTGYYKQGRLLLKIAFFSCIFLSVSHTIGFMSARDAMSLFWAALWGFFAYLNLQQIRTYGGW